MDVQGFHNGVENKPVVGGPKIPVIKTFLEKRWTKLGIWYRLGTFNLGMAFAMVIIGGIVRDRIYLQLIFLPVILGSIISIGKMLKEIYLMDEAQKHLAAKYIDFGEVGKKRLSALLFGKSLSVVGIGGGCYFSILMLPYKDLADRINASLYSLIMEMISAFLMIAWIAIPIILLQQILTKRYVKKHKNKPKNMAESLEEEAMGDLDRAMEIRESRRIPICNGDKIEKINLGISAFGILLVIIQFIF